MRAISDPIHGCHCETVPQKVLTGSKHDGAVLLGDHGRFGWMLAAFFIDASSPPLQDRCYSLRREAAQGLFDSCENCIFLLFQLPPVTRGRIAFLPFLQAQSIIAQGEIVTTTTQPTTAEELLQMPHGDRYQLVRGELRTMSPPSIRHARICMKFSRPLDEYVEKNGLGRVYVGDPGFVLARKPDIVLAPDVAFIRTDRLPVGPEPPGYWEGAPDLAVEVVSPGDTAYEVEEKVEEWLEKGCAMVVVVSASP